ncbi:MAG: peptidase, partial [Cyanobacteria bacterium P01_G01_bin.39]
ADNIESLVINSGSGNDFIDFLGFDNNTDDVIDAGAGDDWINAGFGNDTIEGGLGNDTVEGGSGSDTYIYRLGSGVDVISDSAGNTDTIVFGAAINLDNLSLDFDNNDLTVSFNDSPEDRLVISDYLYSVDSIENIQVAGQTFSVEEIIELTTTPETIGEFGKIDNFDHNSQTIQLDNSYENPVVFALPLSRNGGDPAIVRITDIQNDSFTAYLQEAEYKDGSHTNESFSYMVLEAGTWELDNGSSLEVGTVNTNLVTSEGWENIAFDADFATTPVVLSQVQTNAESDFVRTRQKPASIDGFSLSMEEEDALKASGHANETIGWLAIDAGQGTWGDLQYQAGNTGREVTHRQYSLNFDQDFVSEPSLFASLASYYGGDASGLRYQNLNENQVQIMIEEDQSLDSERNHTREIVDFLAISGNGDLNAFAYEPIDLI